jgi:hypothetical protein
VPPIGEPADTVPAPVEGYVMKHDSLITQSLAQGPTRGAWQPERLRPRRRAAYVPAGRTLHILDIENIMGGPLSGETALKATVVAYRDLAPVLALDHVFIGVNPGLAPAVAAVWPNAQLRVGGGPDGADHVLLDVLGDTAWIASRYDRVVLGSGDGIFAQVVASLRAAGLPVDVAASPASLSLSLVALASSVIFMPNRAKAAA